jgi:hypothetical protein
MEDYRSAHHAKYLERIQKLEKLDKCIDEIKTHVTMNQIKKTVDEMLEIIESNKELDKQKLSSIGLSLVEAINTNKFTVTDFSNQIHVLMSRDVHAIVKNILSLCGIDDTIEVQYDMDCTRDEEIARQLSFEPPVLRRRRARPASARPRRPAL